MHNGLHIAPRLDPHQEAAAAAPHRETFILAGAGAGKTATLAARAQRAIAAGETVRAVTFTRAAAQELERRAPGAKASTLHGLAVEILTGTRAPFVVYDERDMQDLAIMAGEARGVLKPGAWKDARKAAEKVMGDDGGRSDVLAMMRAAHAYDYDGLILAVEMAAMRAADAPMGAGLHLMVDEAQDNDARQWAIIAHMAPARLTVVGDHRQSIYEWRGADPSLFVSRFDAARADGRGYVIPSNYRSGAAIVDAANRLAAPMPSSPPMVAARPDAGCVEVADVLGAIEIARAANGGEPGAVLILARARRDLAAYADALGDLAAPLGRTATWRDDGDCRALLRAAMLAVSPWQDHWARWLALRAGIAAVDVARSMSNCAMAGMPLVTSMAHKIGTLPRTAAELRAAVQLAPYVTGPRDSEAIAAMLADLAAFDGPLSAWLAQGADPAAGDDREVPEAPVWLSTIHGAKGLEAPTVILAGLPGSLKGEDATADGGEPRRLAYVAATRARDRLVVVRRRAAGAAGAAAARSGGDDGLDGLGTFAREIMGAAGPGGAIRPEGELF